MDTLGEIYAKLLEAEKDVLSLMANASSAIDGQTPDYEKMGRYMSIARQIGTARSSMSIMPELSERNEQRALSGSSGHVKVIQDATESGGQIPYQVRKTSDDRPATQKQKNSEYPVYFTFDEKLYKIGKPREESGKLYRKSVKLVDVRRILEVLISLSKKEGSVSIGEIENQLAFPPYKIQITFMALVECKQLHVAGRGLYRFTDVEYSSPDSWMQLLDSLPKRGDLFGEM